MPTTAQLRTRLLEKLKELFQLDQPDLDFGFYRIMHAKARQVTDFLENDLLKTIEDAFGSVDASRRAELQVAYEHALQTARDFVDKVASISGSSGKPYLIHFNDGRETTSREFLLAHLKKLEA